MGDGDLHTLIPFHHIPDLAKNFGKTPQSLPLSSEKSKVHGPQLSKTLLMLLEFFFGPFHLAFQLLGTLLNQLYTGPDPLILNFDLLCGLFRDLFFFEDFDGLSSNDIAEQYLRAQQQQWGEQRPHCGVEAKVRIDISKPGIDAVLYVSTSGSVSYSTKKRYTVILQLVGAYPCSMSSLADTPKSPLNTAGSQGTRPTIGTMTSLFWIQRFLGEMLVWIQPKNSG